MPNACLCLLHCSFPSLPSYHTSSFPIAPLLPATFSCSSTSSLLFPFLHQCHHWPSPVFCISDCFPICTVHDLFLTSSFNINQSIEEQKKMKNHNKIDQFTQNISLHRSNLYYRLHNRSILSSFAGRLRSASLPANQGMPVYLSLYLPTCVCLPFVYLSIVGQFCIFLFLRPHSDI